MGLLARLLGLPGIRRTDRGRPAYRNDAVIQRLMADASLDRDTAVRWFDEMLIFLDLCADSQKPLSPPEAVDQAWHAFLLHTRDYESYCMGRFGKVVHHQPHGEPDPHAYARAWRRRRRWGTAYDGAAAWTYPNLWVTPAEGADDWEDDDDYSGADDSAFSGDVGGSSDPSGDSGGSSCGSGCGSGCGGGD